MLEQGLGLDIDAALNTVTPEQFDEWVAFNEIEPIGEPRRDLRTALLGLNLLAALDASGAELTDFLPWNREPDERPAAEAEADRELDEELEALRAIERRRFAVEAYNARVIARER